MKKKNESKLNNLFRRNKTVFMLAFFFIFLGVGILATTTITNTNVNSPTGTYTNLSADSINEVLYVQAGNETDLRLKINQSRDAGGGVVEVPVGTYNIVNTINLSGDVIVRGQGVQTIIKPTGDFDAFLMCGDYTRLKNLKVDTSIVGYNSTAISFIEDCQERSGWVYLDSLWLVGNENTGNTDKGISLIDDGSGSPGITWILIKNVRIFGYKYGLYIETSDASAYVKGNTFENIQFVQSTYGVYENMTEGSSGSIQGNTFNARMNGNANSEYFAHVEGDQEYFYSVIFDVNTFSSSKAYNLTAKSSKTTIVDNMILSYDKIIDDGVGSNLFLSDMISLGDDLRIKPNATVNNCLSEKAGNMYYDGTTNKHYGCDGTNWNALY